MELPNNAVRFNSSLQLKEASDVTDSIHRVCSHGVLTIGLILTELSKNNTKRIMNFFLILLELTNTVYKY